jgi:hypothetical protein
MSNPTPTKDKSALISSRKANMFNLLLSSSGRLAFNSLNSFSNIPNLDELFTEKSYEELEKVLNDWLSAPAEGAEPEEKVTARPPAAAGKKPSGKSLDDVFAQIENED